jgi:hypothetical protein
MTTQGTFLLADIGGYSSFLSEVGIRHGKEITEHLLNRLIRVVRKQWRVANVMGDCVFFYTGERPAPEQTFSTVRDLYHAFRDAQLEVADGSTCRCGACDRTESLSLKFVVHAGEFDLQNIGGRRELIGPDVVLATRLLKNSVPVREYVIATPPVTGLAAAAGLDAAAARDDLETIGPFDYSYLDLAPMRAAYEEGRRFFISEADAHLSVTAEIEARPDLVWSHMRDLASRAVWQLTIEKMDHIQGQVGEVGEVHSCLHGDGTRFVHAAIAVDHQGRRKTERMWMTPAIMKDIYTTIAAEPLPGDRTLASLRAVMRPRIPVLSHLASPVFKFMMRRSIGKDMRGLKELCETGKVAAREVAAGGSDT